MKKIIYLFIIFGSFNFVEAQTDLNVYDNNNNKNNILSAENTGVHSTSIPLHTFQGREMNLPITLNYSASGIKVAQVASSVGLGWDLNVGGKISRIVYRNPDGWNHPISSGNYCNNDWTLNNKGRDYYIVNANGFNDILQFPSHVGGIEGAVDNYSQTKFLLDNDNELITTNDADDLDDTWIINEKTGVQYFFGENNCKDMIYTKLDPVPPNTDYCEALPKDYSTAWMLTKMISKNGLDEYTFIYEAYEYDAYIQDPKGGEGGKIKTTWHKLKEQMIKEIWYNGSKIISFEYGPRNDLSFIGGTTVGNSLNTIYFYNFKSTTPYKKITFGHDYFGDTNPTAPKINRRLMLTNVVNYSIDLSNNEVAGDSYSFEYESPQNVPPLNSNAQDYLGLYNGHNSNTSLVPYAGSDARNFNFDFAISGTLKKITYPQKGFSEFKYEQNCQNGSPIVYINPSSTQTGYNYSNLLNLSFDYYCDSPLIPEKYRLKNSNMNMNTYDDFPNSPYNSLYVGYIGNNVQIDFFDLSSKTSNTVCRINTSGHGLYAILKLEDCNLADQTHDYCEDEIIKNYYGCAVDTRDIYYTSTASSHNFAGAGLTHSQPTSEINLAPGKYQVILWDINYAGLADPSITIEEQGEPTYYTTPGYYTTSPSIEDGFRINEISNYSNNGNLANKQVFSYEGGNHEDPIHYYQVQEGGNVWGNPWVDRYTSRGYENPQVYMRYRTVSLTTYDEIGESNGSIVTNYITNYYHGSQIYYSGNVAEPLNPGFNYENKNILESKEYYNSENKLVKKEEFFYGNDENEFDTCYSCFDDEYINPQLGRIKTTTFLDSVNSSIETNQYFVNSVGFREGSQVLSKIATEKNNIEYYYSNAYLGPTGYNNAITLDYTWVCSKDYMNCINTQYIKTTLSGQLNGNPINRYLTTEIQTSINNEPLEPKTRFEYDTDGNMVSTVQVTPGTIANNQWDSFIYGYDNRFVVAKLTGIKYSDIPPALINDIKSASNQAITPASITAMETALNALRSSTDINVQNAQITTYTYNPVYGVTSVTDPKGMTIYTEYDAFGRVKLTKEKTANGDLKILSENQYNTRPN